MKFKLVEDNKNIPKIIINIELYYNEELSEDLPSGNKLDTYDDQTIDDWWNFLGNIEEIIECEHNLKLINIAHSDKGHNLSTYYNFYINDDTGNPVKECLINLRVLDHSANSNIKDNRKRHVTKEVNNLGANKYRLYGITINNKLYNTYDDALKEFKNLLDKIVEENK